MEQREIGVDISRGDEINANEALVAQTLGNKFVEDKDKTNKIFESFKDIGILYKELEKESGELETGKDIGALLKRFHCTAEELQKSVFEKRDVLRVQISSFRKSLISHENMEEHEHAQEKYFDLSQQATNLDNLLSKITDYILVSHYQPEPEKKKVFIDPDIYEGKIGKN